MHEIERAELVGGGLRMSHLPHETIHAVEKVFIAVNKYITTSVVRPSFGLSKCSNGRH